VSTTDKSYLELIIANLNDNLLDLERWSIANGDKELDDIHNFQKRFEELAEELRK
jgi:hypothetical protein